MGGLKLDKPLVPCPVVNNWPPSGLGWLAVQTRRHLWDNYSAVNIHLRVRSRCDTHAHTHVCLLLFFFPFNLRCHGSGARICPPSKVGGFPSSSLLVSIHHIHRQITAFTYEKNWAALQQHNRHFVAFLPSLDWNNFGTHDTHRPFPKTNFFQ